MPQTQEERPEGVGGRDARCACMDTHITGSRKQEVGGARSGKDETCRSLPGPSGMRSGRAGARWEPRVQGEIFVSLGKRRVFIWILDVALRKERRKRTLREVAGGGISRTRRKMGGQRPRHKKGPLDSLLQRLGSGEHESEMERRGCWSCLVCTAGAEEGITDV